MARTAFLIKNACLGNAVKDKYPTNRSLRQIMNLIGLVTQDVNIAPKITTPIALTALFLVLAAGILGILATKNQSSTIRNSALRYGFIVTMTLIVLAIVSFLITSSFNREIRISGVVQDRDGKGIGRVVVEIPGKGRGITDAYGGFQFSIPDAYASDKYDVHVNLGGYEPESLTLIGRNPQPIYVILNQRDPLKELVVSVDDDFFVRHGLGIPIVDLHITVTNGMAAAVNVGQFALEVKSPSQSRTSLPLLMVAVNPNMGYLPPLLQLTVEPNQPQQWYFLFSYTDTGMNALADRANKEYMPSAGSFVAADEFRALYSDKLTDQFKAYMQSHFIWEPGIWTLTLYYVINGNKIAYTRHFNLDEKDVIRMKNITNYYKSGIGVRNEWAFVAGVDYNPTVRSTLYK